MDTKYDTTLLALNTTQKSIIEATINYPLEDIIADTGRNPDLTLRALQATLAENVRAIDVELFQRKNLWSNIQCIRNIVLHPCPQNRTENYPYFDESKDPDIIVYKDSNDKPAFEQKGMLGLTARNDNTAEPVTKKAVVSFIQNIVRNLIQDIKPTHYKQIGDAGDLGNTPDHPINLIAENLDKTSIAALMSTCHFFSTNGTLRNLMNNRPISQIILGGLHTLMVTPQGGLYGCGLNEHGELGIKAPSDVKQLRVNCKPGFSRFTQNNICIKQALAIGNHTIILTQDGRLYECGKPGYMETKATSFLSRVLLENISKSSCIKQIFGTCDYTLLLTNDGNFYGRGLVGSLAGLFEFTSETDDMGSEEDYVGFEEDYVSSEEDRIGLEGDYVVAGENYVISETGHACLESNSESSEEVTVSSEEDRVGLEGDYVVAGENYVISETGHACLESNYESSEEVTVSSEEDTASSKENSVSSEENIVLQDFTLLKKKQELMNIHIQDMVIGEEGYTVILTSDSKLYLSLEDEFIQLPLEEIPRDVSIQKIVAGRSNILVLTSEGKLYGFGDNQYGALGFGMDVEQVMGFTRLFSELGNVRIEQVESCNDRTMLLTEDGKLYGCGLNESRSLGLPDITYCQFNLVEISRGEIPADAFIQQISMGNEGTIVITKNGNLYGCGINRYGELGFGDTMPRMSFTLCPVNIEGLAPVMQEIEQEKTPPCCIQ